MRNRFGCVYAVALNVSVNRRGGFAKIILLSSDINRVGKLQKANSPQLSQLLRYSGGC